jgi:hypothetical protein
MKQPVLVAAIIVWVSFAATLVTGAAPPGPPVLSPTGPFTLSAAAQNGGTGSDASTYRGVLDTYCVGCHNDSVLTAGLSLQGLDLARTAEVPGIWERVIRKVDARMMPPSGMPRPDVPIADGLVAFLRSELDRAAAAAPDPGRPLLQRLNRTEYSNTIRDLLGVDVDVSSLLPPDDSGYGFDNVTDVLGVSSLLLEGYLSAAEKVTSLALGDPDAAPTSEIYRVRQDASQHRNVDGLPLGTVGGLAVETTLLADGEYILEPKLFRTNLGTMRGLENLQRLEIAVDGVRVHLAAFGGNEEVARSSDNPTTTGNAVDERLRVRVPLTAGSHTITVAFLERSHVQNTWRLERFERSSADTIDFGGYPHLDTFTVSGPFDVSGVSETPSRQRLLTCRPADPAGEATCAREILAGFTRRAYRGQQTDADVVRVLEFYEAGRLDGGSFEDGIGLALRRVLSSPKFIFRAEPDPDGPADLVYEVGELELASRLSFFLWSSIPDEPLLDAAEQGRLRDPAVLDGEVRRMLNDPRATAALADNFLGQWLYLRNLSALQPNSTYFPDFDDDLRRSFERETQMLFETVMRDDRSVLELLTADYTYVDERLARHYGIPGVYGSYFREVPVSDLRRQGVLGHGSFLLVTSHAARTSPVRRGKWILENLLGTPPPAPPPNVPALPEPDELERPLTMREQMEEHRRNPVCASCHAMLDPIGLALENFDVVGAWRDRDRGDIQTLGPVIDATVELLDGTRVDGPVELRQAILQRPEVFVRTFTEKLMTFALGRGVRAEDMPAVRAVVRDAAEQGYSFTSIVVGIVNSTPFQMRIKVG